jgi:hypothetical protein
MIAATLNPSALRGLLTQALDTKYETAQDRQIHPTGQPGPHPAGIFLADEL